MGEIRKQEVCELGCFYWRLSFGNLSRLMMIKFDKHMSEYQCVDTLPDTEVSHPVMIITSFL